MVMGGGLKSDQIPNCILEVIRTCMLYEVSSFINVGIEADILLNPALMLMGQLIIRYWEGGTSDPCGL